MRASIRSLYLLLLIPGIIKAQQSDKQYWNWYFGNQVAIRFTSTSLPPVFVAGSVMNATEGASAVSDTNGNMLYYSNGQTVWDSQNQVLPNGTGLKGHYWSAQSALIVKMPGSDSLHYIFTVSDWEETANELNYSIIDKSMNGGFGAITTQKNILVNDSCAEHLAAAYHANGTDIWILSHEIGNNHFVAYLLTSQGLNTVPVVSAAGAIYDGMNRFGYMRVSPYCNRIATALGKQMEMNIPDTTAQVFDFDNSSGVVSNAVFIGDLTNMESAYCCEFSPDNSKVYFTEFSGSAIYQIDLNAPNPAASITNISSSTSGINSSLTLGPDNKIYVTKYFASYIGVINAPNLAGVLCDHVDNVLSVTNNNNSISTCNVLRQCTVFTGVESVADQVPTLLVFPNPANGSATISLQNAHAGSSFNRVEVIDATGRLKYSIESDETQFFIDTRLLSRGIYMVKMETGDKIFVRKLILE